MKKLIPTLTAYSLIAMSALSQPADNAADRAALLKDVKTIDAPGLPGPICVFGPSAFAVVAGKGSGKNAPALPVVAAARFGQGRVFAFGHDGYLAPASLQTADTGQLFANAIAWVKPGAAQPEIVVLRGKSLAAHLEKTGFKIVDGGLDQLTPGQVLVLPAMGLSEPEIAAVSKFVQAGGGLVCAGLGWGWQQLNPKKELAVDMSLNRLLAPAGLVWTEGEAGRTAGKGYAATNTLSPLLNASTALDAALAHTAGRTPLTGAALEQTAATLSLAAASLPPTDKLLLPRLQQLTADPQANLVPTPKKPVKSSDLIARVVLPMQARQMKSLAPAAIKVHPASEVFPGSVPAAAPRLTSRRVTIDTSIPDWHSTGLYAPPGEVVTIEIPETATKQGLGLRIGAHTDHNWHHAAWTRFPEISRHDRLDSATTKVASAFGGLIYVTVPNKSGLGQVTVQISGAVAAPLFVAGKTTLSEWRDTLRQAPAPWAELASDKVIVTLPSAAIRALDDPEALMQVWRKVLDLDAELAGRPLLRERPERIVTDEQISAGYMHSGYPIMTWMDQVNLFPSRESLLQGNWGIFHELGHNHQSSDWTFDGTGEVTCNLFTLYVYDKLCGVPPKTHPRVSGKERTKLLTRYFATKPDFEKWKSDPFLALMMYVQLQEAFGWETYQKVFAEYRALPAAARPKGDLEKHDQWMTRFARAANKNLGPFFQAWGVPVSDKALASIATLPVWMPPDLPVGK